MCIDGYCLNVSFKHTVIAISKPSHFSHGIIACVCQLTVTCGLQLSFRQILQFRFRDIHMEGSPVKVAKTKPFLSRCYCYGNPSATEATLFCYAATNKLTFPTTCTSVSLLLNEPLSLSRETFFRWQKNPRRG